DETRRVRAINPTLTPKSWGGMTIATGGIVSVAGGFGSADYLVLDSGQAIAQGFEYAGAPALDAAGDMLIPDVAAGALRNVDHTTDAMSVVAGYGKGGTLPLFLGQPSGLAAAPDGTLIATVKSARLLRIDR